MEVSAQSIIDANSALDQALDDAPADLVFLSDSSLPNPTTSTLLSRYRRELERQLDSEWQMYYLMEKDPGLSEQIRRFHAAMAESLPPEQEFVAGTGSAAFLSTILSWARERGEKRAVICSPPYVKVPHWLQQLGFATKIAYDPLTIEPLDFTLPEERSFAILTDPIWFAGRRVPMGLISRLREWQERTGSLVFVDGTFQYMAWRQPLYERSSLLDPERTIRLVCPTKSLAAHGFRFAYAIAPPGIARELKDLYRLMHGAASFADGAFAQVAMKSLLSPVSNRGLVGDAARRARALAASSRCLQMIPPESGYFVFMRPAPGILSSSVLAMDPSCFGLAGYEDFIRVNVLSDEAMALLGASVEESERPARLEWMRATDDPLLDGPVPEPPGAWSNDPRQASPNDPTSAAER